MWELNVWNISPSTECRITCLISLESTLLLIISWNNANLCVCLCVICLAYFCCWFLTLVQQSFFWLRIEMVSLVRINFFALFALALLYMNNVQSRKKVWCNVHLRPNFGSDPKHGSEHHRREKGGFAASLLSGRRFSRHVLQLCARCVMTSYAMTSSPQNWVLGATTEFDNCFWRWVSSCLRPDLSSVFYICYKFTFGSFFE